MFKCPLSHKCQRMRPVCIAVSDIPRVAIAGAQEAKSSFVSTVSAVKAWAGDAGIAGTIKGL